MSPFKFALLSAALTAVFALPAMAADEHAAHMKAAAAPAASSADCAAKPWKPNGADRALLLAGHKMHKAMDVAFMNTADADFVRAMIPHHQGAVDMAQVVVKYGKDEEIGKLAKSIIKTQGWEIGAMHRWLELSNQADPGKIGHKAMERSADTPERKELAMINHEMHHAMMTPMSGNADKDFVRGMIPHHQGAIEMARWEMENGINPQVRAMAADMIKAQRVEIAQMRAWQAANDKPVKHKRHKKTQCPTTAAPAAATLAK